MTFHFAPNVKVIVENGDGIENGAKLILDNTTFTSLNNCIQEDFWTGIEVWGTPIENQFPVGSPTFQGYCKLINGATIENAVCGLRNCKEFYDGQDGFNRQGGVIIAEDANFVNNIRSVAFRPYTNYTATSPSTKCGDLSHFHNCTFEVNDDYFDIPGKHFMKHVELWRVRGIKFNTCDFSNTQTNKVYAQNQNSNQAIYALSAGFSVTGSCIAPIQPGYPCPETDLTRSTFEGFNIAIRLQTESSTATAHIERSWFDNNARAIQVEGVNNTVITRNDFELGDCEISGIPGNPISYEYGIKLIKCTGFMIEENEMEGVDTYIHPPIGICPQQTNDGYSDNNQVYKNKLNKMSTALLPQGINQIDENTGLQLLCNDFDYTISRDIDVRYMPNDFGNIYAGIRYYQGNTIGTNVYSAGNSFTYNNANIEYNYFYGTDGGINYYFNAVNDYTQEPAPNKYNDTKVHLYNTDVFENTCPSNIINGAHFPMDVSKVSSVYSDFSVGKTAYTNLYYAYLQEIDGGSTPAVLQQIQNTWPQEAWDLRNDLMALAPYVSEEALLEAAFSDVLPDAMLFEICLANPDATRSDEFLRILHEDIPNPLPQYMCDLIRENWDLETPRTILERNIASAAYKMDYNLNLLLTNESLKDEPDVHLLRNYRSQRDYLNDRYSIVDSYIEEEKFDSSVLVLNQIPVDFTLDDAALDEYDNFYLYHDLLKSLNDSNRTILELDSTEVDLLEQIADDKTGPSAIKSRNILCFAFGLCEEYPGNSGDTSQHKSSSFEGNPLQIINEAYTTVEVSPNPATQYAEFSWEILNLNNEALLEIFDVSGKPITSHSINSKQGKWIWDTREVKPGIYIYSVGTNESKLANGKITVQKE